MSEWIVTSTALILIVLALRGILKGKISLRLQYALWALVLIRLLIPFSVVESVISVGNLTKNFDNSTAVNDLQQYGQVYDELKNSYAQSGAEISTEQLRQETSELLYKDTLEAVRDDHAGETVSDAQLQDEAQQRVRFAEFAALAGNALPYIWGVGVLAVAASLVISNLYFWIKLRRTRSNYDISGVPLRVYCTSYTATPCLFGFPVPAVYLTDEVINDREMRMNVLAHEMTHYRQGDHIWAVLRCACLALHWYNPLVWAAAIISKRDAELACDEATIAMLGEQKRTAYGRTLIGMTCVKRDPRNLMLTATTMLGSKKTLKERISLIAKKPKTTLYTLIVCILVSTLAVGCTFTGVPEAPASDPTTTTTDPTTEPTEAPTTEPTAAPTEAPTTEPTAAPTEAPTTPPTTEPTAEPTEEPTAPALRVQYPDLPEAVTERRQLTAEELFEFEAMFHLSVGNVYNFALTSLYETPADVDLMNLFYSMPLEEITQEDLDFYGSNESQLHKYSVSVIDEVLGIYFGISLDDTNGVGLDRMRYNEEGRCYYHMHGDFQASYHTLIEGYVNPDNTVELFYINQIASIEEDVIQVVTIRYVDQGTEAPCWQIVSNVLAE